MAEGNRGIPPDDRPPSGWRRILNRFSLGKSKPVESQVVPHKEPDAGESPIAEVVTPDVPVSAPAEETSTNLEEIKLGQLFDVFPEDKRTVGERKGFPSVERRFKLVTGGLPVLPMRISARHAHSWKKGEVYLPFNPELGSTFDEAERDIEKRARKLISETSGPDLDNSVAGLVFDARGLEKELFELGVTRDAESDSVKPEFGPLVSRLRLQVFFPDSSFEGQPFDLKLKGRPVEVPPSLYFSSFDPLEKQPSASAPPERPPIGFYVTPSELLLSGKRICLPPDLEKLGQIKARFIMVDEQGRSPVPDVFRGGT